MELIVIIIIVVVIWAYFSAKQSEREQVEARKKRERIAHIKRDYPNAYAEYWGKPVTPTPYYRYGGNYYSAYLRKADESFSDAEWEELEKRVLKNKEEAREIDRKKKADKDWEIAQISFATKMRSIVSEKLPLCGNYTYTVGVKTKVGSQLNMTIWQHFFNEVCLEKDLDYTYNQLTLNNNNILPKWQERGVYFNEATKRQICDLLNQLALDKKLLIFFNEVIEGWSIETLSNTYMGIELPKLVDFIDVASDKALKIDTLSGMELLAKETPDCVVVIDAFTTNEKLKKNCEYIFNILQDKRPVLAYISLIKTYDRQEMINYINISKTKAEKRAAEERAKEEERKKREAEELAEKKRKDEERARLQGSAKSVLVNKAKGWEHLYRDFYYTWLLYYYPTTCDFEASESEWDDRYTVWNFKNDPEKGVDPEDHETALDEVTPQLIQRLNDTFGKEYLQFITLVCLPASTNAKNAARYDEFSKKLCSETGMENAYGHIHIVKDGMSKKHPDNHTGRSIQPVIEYDEEFFNGKYVLLFDDVVTKGNTMLLYKDVMERMGAIVIGGMCIGKTKHERDSQGFTTIIGTPTRFNGDIGLIPWV